MLMRIVLQGGFDNTKPFEGPGIADIVQNAFFKPSEQYHNIGIKQMQALSSMPLSPRNEPEISPVMLALAATAVRNPNLLRCAY